MEDRNNVEKQLVEEAVRRLRQSGQKYPRAKAEEDEAQATALSEQTPQKDYSDDGDFFKN
jgi:hypothetical protein